MQFEGVLPAVLTPFGDGGALRNDVLEAQVDWYIKSGVDGIVAIGTLGEFRSLTSEERRQVVDTVIAASNGRVPITIGEGRCSTRGDR